MFDRVMPIETDDDVLGMAREVIGDDATGARTTWLLFLDDTDRPVPTVVPIDGLPVDPDPEDVERLVDGVRMILGACEAAQVVVVWERGGSGAIRMQEADWVAAVAASGLPVRAQLLATEDGVRLLDPSFEGIVAG